MLCADRSLVSRVREICMHGLKGGPDDNPLVVLTVVRIYQ